jgi:hypothetical protein
MSAPIARRRGHRAVDPHESRGRDLEGNWISTDSDPRWREEYVYDDAYGPPDPHQRSGPLGRRIDA